MWGDMGFVDDWRGRIGLLYLAWPVLVMLAFVVWRAFKADSISGFITGLYATVVFGTIALVGWVFASAIVLGALIMAMLAMGLHEGLIVGVIFAIGAIAMTMGAKIGWQYLSDNMGTDARQWKLW